MPFLGEGSKACEPSKQKETWCGARANSARALRVSVEAGDQLTFKFPTWQWDAGDPQPRLAPDTLQWATRPGRLASLVLLLCLKTCLHSPAVHG